MEDQVALRIQVIDYLEEHNVMSLATIGPEGPWSTAVYYACRGLDFFYVSGHETRHSRNLALNPVAAATIQENYADWREVQGIQMEGEVTQLGGAAAAGAAVTFLARFPFLKVAGTALQQAMSGSSWYRFRPTRLHFVDNSRGFGHRSELELGD